jgi:hypothetical protein
MVVSGVCESTVGVKIGRFGQRAFHFSRESGLLALPISAPGYGNDLSSTALRVGQTSLQGGGGLLPPGGGS